MPSSGCQTCRSEEHTSELQSHSHLVCRLLLEKKERRVRSEEHTSELQSHSPLVCRPLLEKKEWERREAARRRRGTTRDKTSQQRARVHEHPDRKEYEERREPRLARHELHLLFFNDTATTEIYTLSLHDALPI